MEIYEVRSGELLVSTDRARLDFALIHGLLAESYWPKGITIEQVRRQIEHSAVVFGLYRMTQSTSDRPGELSSPTGPGRRAGRGRRLEAAATEPRETSNQIGFARVVSDLTRTALINDVLIVPEEQRKGYGQLLLRAVMDHPELCGIRKWLLATKDAHGVYAKLGFSPLPNPEAYMVLKNREARWV